MLMSASLPCRVTISRLQYVLSDVIFLMYAYDLSVRIPLLSTLYAMNFPVD